MLGKTVVLTREAELSAGLAAQISEQGGKVITMPALETRALESAPVPLPAFDLLVFVSRNAVKYAMELIPDLQQQGQGTGVFAMGMASRDELLACGFESVRHAPGAGGSEALLAMPDLQPENVKDRKVLVLSGKGGLDLLDTELHRRGAKVQKLELYQRQMPKLDPVAISQIWQVEKPDAVVIYSGEGLQNLVELTPHDDREVFLQTPMVVISERLRKVAEESGFNGKVCVAESYTDEAILDAIEKLLVTGPV